MSDKQTTNKSLQQEEVGFPTVVSKPLDDAGYAELDARVRERFPAVGVVPVVDLPDLSM